MTSNRERIIHVCPEHLDGPCEPDTVDVESSSIPPNTLICVPESDAWVMHLGEPITKYCPGGLHPVNLFDTFRDGRYRVVHKLGWGRSSTAWLARDGWLQRWVALKIIGAKDTVSSRELSTLQVLHHTGASRYLPTLLDHFKFEGPNGIHQCLVLEVLGPDVNQVVLEYSDNGDRMHKDVFMKICRQFLRCLSEVHQAGYAHGDIENQHIVFAATKLANVSERELFATLGRPKTAQLSLASGAPLCSGLPRHIVDQVNWEDFIDEDEEDIRVIGWSTSWVRGAEPSELDQEHGVQVPETFFTSRYDYTVDLWRAGYMIYQWLYATTHFCTSTRSTCSYIAAMIGFVENLPPEWERRWVQIQLESGWFPYIMTGESWMVRCWNSWPHEPEVKPLLNVVMGLMRFRPYERVSAAEAIRLSRGVEQYPLVIRDCT